MNDRHNPAGHQTTRTPRPQRRRDEPSTRTDTSRSAQVISYVEVLHALCDLERVDRAALRLIYCHGLTQAQAARELALPESTVQHCVARGMRQLADRLTSTEVTSPGHM